SSDWLFCGGGRDSGVWTATGSVLGGNGTMGRDWGEGAAGTGSGNVVGREDASGILATSSAQTVRTPPSTRATARTMKPFRIIRPSSPVSGRAISPASPCPALLNEILKLLFRHLTRRSSAISRKWRRHIPLFRQIAATLPKGKGKQYNTRRRRVAVRSNEDSRALPRANKGIDNASLSRLEPAGSW